MMLWKRTTAPDGIRDPGRPPLFHVEPARAGGIARALRTLAELVRAGSRVQHRPTIAQLRTMAMLDGRSPASYRLDPAVNPLPASLPTDFPHGQVGLLIDHAGGRRVVLPTAGASRSERGCRTVTVRQRQRRTASCRRRPPCSRPIPASRALRTGRRLNPIPERPGPRLA